MPVTITTTLETPATVELLPPNTNKDCSSNNNDKSRNIKTRPTTQLNQTQINNNISIYRKNAESDGEDAIEYDGCEMKMSQEKKKGKNKMRKGRNTILCK